MIKTKETKLALFVFTVLFLPSLDHTFTYQTEARTKTLIDSTEIQGGVYNFRKFEVSRGFMNYD